MTPEQIKHNLRQQGLTIKQWAIQNGYQPSQVYRVINGESQARYGQGRKIALALGIQPIK